MGIFKGSGVALITPFNEDMSINYTKLEELIEWHIENKTDALVIAGTTGEASTLPDEEHIELVRRSVEVANARVPVIAGTGSNDTRHGVRLSLECEKVGADGLLIVTPYYNKTNRQGLINHYTTIADKVNIPIILYNVPGRTGMNIPTDVVVELSNHKNIVGLKEASGDISYLAEVARVCDKDFSIYSGNDDIIVPVLSLGGVGVISVLANVMPLETHNIVMSYLEGDVARSRDLQLSLNSFVNSLFLETNPIPVKSAMNLMNMNVGGLRQPLWEISSNAQELLKIEMKKVNLI
ncbi:4-hydroxy-tetrahydrodipicolinate synthase [Psychrilyobacter atlanticus]|uniref:4-hydroxy-tetrahydrodipicolinate synthase n=1 Tax=Psychrilyobacter atlanticus TaxID=271091 RepID=UPI0004027441|nr:4-hydroxy-tetrahydrodipicolinate synthase [Psychrilyobacter atlanticus]